MGNLTTPKRVQKLQTALHAKAKAEAGRFYALYDKISRDDILAHAYAQCRRSNKGAPGIDGQDFADIEAYGVERWLTELASVYTEGQRQTQAAGHLRRAGSGLHDSSAAGAGADLRSRGAGKQVRAARSTPWSTAKGCRCGSSSTSCDPGAGLVLTRYEGASRGPNGSGPMAATTPGRLKPRWQRYRCYAWRSPSGATT